MENRFPPPPFFFEKTANNHIKDTHTYKKMSKKTEMLHLSFCYGLKVRQRIFHTSL